MAELFYLGIIWVVVTFFYGLNKAKPYNLDNQDIQAKLKKVEKKTWIKIGVAAGAVIFFLIIFYGVLNPIVNKKKAQLDDMNKKKTRDSRICEKHKICKKKDRKKETSV